MTSLNTFLLLFIFAKIVCLFFCWKMIKTSKKGQPDEVLSPQDIDQLSLKVEQLKKANKQLNNKISSIKNQQS